MKKSMTLLALLGLLFATLAACGGSKDHNDADVTFVQQMLPHHKQAVGMSDTALKTSKNADVLALAAQIKAAQDPEIAKMNSWLSDWDAKASDQGGMAGMDHGGGGMGMMTGDEMKSLDTATGAAFDTAWLTLMIKHHKGAVAMAKTEATDGKSAEAKKLADQIITGQEAEIATMTGLLGA